MSMLVVGSVAYDTVETSFGKAERVLGGSASFFSVAASVFTPVRHLVAVVGGSMSHNRKEAQNENAHNSIRIPAPPSSKRQ